MLANGGDLPRHDLTADATGSEASDSRITSQQPLYESADEAQVVCCGWMNPGISIARSASGKLSDSIGRCRTSSRRETNLHRTAP